MKKWIAMLLAAILVLSMTACGTVNKTEVAVLWSGEGVVRVPDSLINAMERAMYIESVAYAHYGANGDQAAQTAKAEEVLNAGAAALAVELVEDSAAQTILDLAKAKNVPVVFFNCTVEETVLSGYDKAVCVSTDETSVDTVLGQLVGELAVKDYETYDRDGDGKLGYLVLGDRSAAVETVDAALLEAEKSVMGLAGEATAEEAAAKIAALEVVEGTNGKGKAVSLLRTADFAVEVIFTENDAVALEVLKALQEKGFNTDKLTTHFVPVFTVGAETSAVEFANTDNMTEEELAAFIYNAKNIIGAGQLTGAALEDYDAIAGEVAASLRSLLKGKAPEAVQIKVPYTAYKG